MIEILETFAYVMIALIPIFIFIGGFIWLGKKTGERYESFGSQRITGKYRVRYEDGRLSQPMNLTTARNYAQMFGGKVVKK